MRMCARVPEPAWAFDWRFDTQMQTCVAFAWSTMGEAIFHPLSRVRRKEWGGEERKREEGDMQFPGCLWLW